MSTDKDDVDGKCSNVEVGHDTRQVHQGEHVNPNNRPNQRHARIGFEAHRNLYRLVPFDLAEFAETHLLWSNYLVMRLMLFVFHHLHFHHERAFV